MLQFTLCPGTHGVKQWYRKVAGCSLWSGGRPVHLLVMHGSGRSKWGWGEPAPGGGPRIWFLGDEAKSIPWHSTEQRECPAGFTYRSCLLLHGPAWATHPCCRCSIWTMCLYLQKSTALLQVHIARPGCEQPGAGLSAYLGDCFACFACHPHFIPFMSACFFRLVTVIVVSIQ